MSKTPRIVLLTLLFLASCSIRVAEPPLAPAATSGEFIVSCAMANRASDDPIVKPGQVGGSHSHDFFGAAGTDANSTETSMQAAVTTCVNTPGDTAGYWVPTAFRPNGEPLKMERARLYYRTGGVPKEYVKPFPAGLKMVVGDAMSMAPQNLAIVSWACTVTGSGTAGDEVEVGRLPVCPDDSPSVRLKVVFPNCWNGRDLDSPDHKSHMAYSSSSYKTLNRCPVGWTAVPKLTMGVRYPFRAGGFSRQEAPDIRLNMGHYSGHADFWNTWKQGDLERLVTYCLVGGRSCGDAGGPRK